jgi:putative PEP-CTERM system TPR-repeat lipoprotein
MRGQAELQLGDPAAAKAAYADAEHADPTLVQPWIADARLAISEHDFAAAKQKIAQALQAEPNSADALVLKSIVMAQGGDRAGAMALLDKLIASQPGALAARVPRASILLSEGKAKEAEKDVNTVLALTPGNIQALYLKADILHLQKKNRDAAALLQKLQPTFDLVPRGYLLMALVSEANGQTQVAEENAAKYIGRVPQDVAGYITLAHLYLANQRPDLALQPLNQAVSAGEVNAAVYQLLGRAQMLVHRPDLAAQAFAKLRQMSPGNVPVILESAQALEQSGHPDQAEDLIRSAFKTNPTQPQLQDALVAAALATGDIARARAALAMVTQAGGNDPSIQNLKAVVQIADLDPAGAAATLEPVVKAHPELAVARLNLARAYSLMGKNDAAKQQLEAILKTDPAFSPALTVLVANHERLHQLPQAIALLETAHAAQPQNDALTAELGSAYLRANQPEKALNLATAGQTATGHPSPILLELAAQADIALKHFDDARSAYNQLMQVAPRAVQARLAYAQFLISQKDYEGARTVLSQGMAATPRVYDLELAYALVDLKASGIDKALQTAASLRQQDLTFGPLVAMKGDIYIAAGKPADAIPAYQQAFASNPSNELVLRLAAAYTRVNDLPKARAVLADWMSKHPKDYTVLAQLSTTDIALKNYPAAQTELTTLVGVEPRSAPLLNNLAWVDQLLGDKQALSLAERSYMLDQGPASADTLGWILTKQGDPQKGAELLRQAVTSGDPQIAYHLAVALKDLGQKDQAVKLLDAVTKVKGDFTEKAEAEKLLGEMTKGS